MCSLSNGLSALIEDLVLLEDCARIPRVDEMVRGWPTAERQQLSNEMSTLLSRRAVFVQTEGLAAHERGEDVSAASAQLASIVDMTVQVKMLVRNLTQEEAD